MEKELDLYTLLKGHKNIHLYMPMYGEVILIGVGTDFGLPFLRLDIGDDEDIIVGSDGKHCSKGEVCIFPSKEQRDWSLFKPPWIPKHGERVWVSYPSHGQWEAKYFCRMADGLFVCYLDQKIGGTEVGYSKCVPFNEIPW